MEIVDDSNKIKDCQQRFKQTLESTSSESFKAPVGHPQGTYEMDMYYFETSDFWYGSPEPDNKDRFWNPFGLGYPDQESNNSIVVEINFPYDGNMRYGGTLVEDSDGNILVCHSGKIGGGREGIGKTKFWNKYTGRQETVSDFSLAVIAPVNSSDLPVELGDFVKEVKRIKNSIAD